MALGNERVSCRIHQHDIFRVYSDGTSLETVPAARGLYPSLYPRTYNSPARLDLYGMHESPSGTILKKDLEIQGLFFRL
jgi:hypothetical protein